MEAAPLPETEFQQLIHQHIGEENEQLFEPIPRPPITEPPLLNRPAVFSKYWTVVV